MVRPVSTSCPRSPGQFDLTEAIFKRIRDAKQVREALNELHCGYAAMFTNVTVTL